MRARCLAQPGSDRAHGRPMKPALPSQATRDSTHTPSDAEFLKEIKLSGLMATKEIPYG